MPMFSENFMRMFKKTLHGQRNRLPSFFEALAFTEAMVSSAST